MSEKKNGNSGGYLTKTGITVIVLLCVCIIGMSYSVFKAYRAVRDIDAESFDKDAWESALAEIEEEPVEEYDEPLPTDESYDEEIDESYVAAEVYDEPSEAEDVESVEVVPAFNDNESGLSMTLPLTGRIICDYSAEDLVYSETFDDWRAHLGIDIAASSGTPVLTAAAGVVERVVDDDSMGLTVTVRHTNHISTLYSGLSSTELSEGSSVATGALIGLSGDAPAFENASEPHMHFEVLRDGEPTDPYEYLVFEE